MGLVGDIFGEDVILNSSDGEIDGLPCYQHAAGKKVCEEKRDL